MKKYGFTLAETLITLTIIGVIAALTIPNLFIKYEKEETVTKLKKFYSEFSHAIALSEIDNGPADMWTFPYEIRPSEFHNTYIKNYTKGKLSNGYQITDIQGKDNQLFNFGTNTYSLPNGTTYTFNSANADDIFLMVDINGPKKPNRFGKDVFMFIINKNSRNKRLQPYGEFLTREELTSTAREYSCNKTVSSGKAGVYCAALIRKDNWQIKDDYPW